jgi:hypothetical protein
MPSPMRVSAILNRNASGFCILRFKPRWVKETGYKPWMNPVQSFLTIRVM